jgi:hypothetical protein
MKYRGSGLQREIETPFSRLANGDIPVVSMSLGNGLRTVFYRDGREELVKDGKVVSRESPRKRYEIGETRGD